MVAQRGTGLQSSWAQVLFTPRTLRSRVAELFLFTESLQAAMASEEARPRGKPRELDWRSDVVLIAEEDKKD